MHLWGVRSLNKIGRTLGKPLVTDECTTSKARVSYTRILVEVDVTQELLNTANIKDMEGRVIKQPIDYEWKPLFCGKCQKFGHGCKKKVVKKWKPKPTDEKKIPPIVPPTNNEAEILAGIEDVHIEDSGKEWETVLNSRDMGKKIV